MTAGAAGSLAVAPDGGYAPDFLVKVEGQPVDDSTKNDVLSIQVTRDVKEMASFAVDFNNWDDRGLRYKYFELPEAEFAVGRRVEIQLGYGDRLVSVVTGQITSLRPSFPSSGAPIIGVGGTDGMQKLKRRKPREDEQKLFLGQADWEIAKAIAIRNKLDHDVKETGPVHERVWQRQDDAVFLMERAKRIDFECYLMYDARRGRDVLHFHPPTDGREGQRPRVYQLAYGPGLAAEEEAAGPGAAGTLLPNLIEFTPTLTLSKQVSKVTVWGWNPRTKKPITFTADRSHLPSLPGRSGQDGPKVVEETLGDRQETVRDAPVDSDEEARELAISLLRERAYQFNTGSGRIAGLPELRPDDNVELHGLGQRFSGFYRVTKVAHRLDSGGFFTSFEVERPRDGSPR